MLDKTEPGYRSLDIRIVSKIPFEIVKDAFDGFIPPDEKGAERGGLVVPKPTFLNKHPDTRNLCPYSPGYHRESSFTPTQERFVNASFYTMNMLALGLSHEGQPITARTFSERIVYEGINGYKGDFREPFYRAIHQLLIDWGNLYPNLIPATKAAFKVAAVEGIGEASDNTWFAMRDARAGKLNSVNIDGYQNSNVLHERFLRPHVKAASKKDPTRIDCSVDYEVRCLAEPFAKTLIREAKIAAVILARDPSIANLINERGSYPNTNSKAGFDEGLLSVVNKLRSGKPGQNS